VEEAIDKFGQRLVQPAPFVGDMPPHPEHLDELIVVWSGADMVPRGDAPQARVRLIRGAKPAHLIKEMRGTLSIEVETPMTPLVTIADVLKSGGQAFHGPDGARVQVLEVAPDSDQYRLKVEVKLPAVANPLSQFRLWAAPGVVPVGGTVNLNGAEAQQKGLALYDAQGQPFLLATGSYERAPKPDAPVTYTLFYQPRKEQGPPAKFVLSGRRTVVLEMPFVLWGTGLKRPRSPLAFGPWCGKKTFMPQGEVSRA
jgi:hypothetical protein